MKSGSFDACADCGQAATFALEENGNVERVCSRCLERRTGLPGLSDFYLAFQRPRPRAERCPFCGTTAEDAIKSGLAGCPLCYESLQEAWDILGVTKGKFDWNLLG